MIIDRDNANVVWFSPWPGARPAGPGGRRARRPPRGPDDDPEFLRQLDQRIHGTPTDPAE